MKTVQDKDGNIIEVSDDTPCHPGKNGALPVLLDPVLDADVFIFMEERDAKAVLDRPREDVLKEIQRLESQITPRRIREAVAKPSRDVGGKTAAQWLEDQEDLIAVERAKLT